MLRLLTRSLPLLAAALLVAGSASALPTTYYMWPGTQMSMVNQLCAPGACTVPVTGTIELDDDGLGNVTLTDVNLTHIPYQVGLVGLISIVIDRDSITLGAGSVAGTGSTLTSVLFGSTSFAQVGTITCTGGVVSCATAGLPAGASALASPIPVTLGTFTFDGLGGFTASILYTSTAQATETLTLNGSTTFIPEPGTGLLVAMGVFGLALRRRARL